MQLCSADVRLIVDQKKEYTILVCKAYLMVEALRASF